MDNYYLFQQHDYRQEQEREKLPCCDYCGEEIMDEHCSTEEEDIFVDEENEEK